MRSSLLTCALLLFITPFVSAQFHLGVKFGVQTTNLGDNITLDFNNNASNLNIDNTNLNRGFHLGPIIATEILNIKIESGLLFNFSQTQIKEFDQGLNTIRKNISTFDIPLTVGIPFLFLDFHAGVLGHKYILSNTTEDLSLGFLFGTGLNIKNISFDLDFELNPNKVSYVVDVEGIPYQIEEFRHQVFLSASYLFK